MNRNPVHNFAGRPRRGPNPPQSENKFRAQRPIVAVAILLLGALSLLAGGSHASAASRRPSAIATAILGPTVPRMADAPSPTDVVADPATEDVATKRREILDYMAAMSGPSPAPATAPSDLQAPQGEVMLALQELSDAEVVRLHDALPIIHHWRTIQARMASGLAELGTSSQQQPRGERTFSPSQVAELEQFRADLDTVFVRQQSWLPLIGRGDPTFLSRIDDGRKLVQDATVEDLSDLRDAVVWIPDWRNTLAPDLVGLLGPGDVGPLAQTPPGSGAAQTDGVQPAVTSEQCSDADRSRDVLPLIIASAVVKGTAMIEDFVANFFTKDIKLCFAIIVVTVCVDFPNPVFFILKLLQFASNRVVEGLDAAVLVAGVCTSIDHWNLTVQHRDNFLLNAQDILSSIIARQNELIDRTEQVDRANREDWKLELQLAIEENLSLPLPAPDGSDENRISLFQLTDTVCFNPDELLPTPVPVLPTPDLVTPAADVAPPPALAALPTPRSPTPLTDRREQCGITLVKRIVDEAIQLNKLAGTNIHDADTLFAAANTHFAAGRYKEAYLRYRQAYLAAVQPDAEPRRLFTGTVDR